MTLRARTLASLVDLGVYDSRFVHMLAGHPGVHARGQPACNYLTFLYMSFVTLAFEELLLAHFLSLARDSCSVRVGVRQTTNTLPPSSTDLQVTLAFEELMLAHKKEVHCTVVTAQVGKREQGGASYTHFCCQGGAGWGGLGRGGP